MTTRARRWSLFAACIAIAAILPVAVPHPFVLGLLAQALVWALLAASWDLLSGYTGQISFGHAGFFAIGAYTGAALALHLKADVWVALLGGIALPALVGFALGYAVLRLHGHYLALVTLGFAEITRLVAINWLSVTGGPFGIHDYGTFPGVPADPIAQRQVVFYIVLAIFAVALALMLWLCEETDTGKLYRAIREDATLAESHGIHVSAHRIGAFTVSAAFAGLAGGLYAFVVGLVNPSNASALTSSLVIGMAVFGGLGTIWGAAAGGVLLFLASEALRFVGVVWNLIAVGLVIMLFVIFVPRGLAGLRLPQRGRELRRDAQGARGGVG